jgi:hypothetical protein
MNKIALVCIIGIAIYPFLIPLFFNDEFTASTMIAAKLLLQSGSTFAGSNFLLATNEVFTHSWTWQQQTASLLTSFPGSVYLLSETTLITGVPLPTLTYLPVSYSVLLLSVYLLARMFYRRFFANGQSTILLVCILSMYSMLSWDVAIENVGFGYLSVTFAESMLIFYLIIKCVDIRSFKRYEIPLVLLFLAITITHLREPILILGGLVTYGLFLIISGSAKAPFLTQLLLLGVVLFIIISFQPTYFSLLGQVNIGYAFDNFIRYLAGGFERTIYELPNSAGVGVPTPLYATIIQKISGWFDVGVIAIISVPLMLSRKLRSYLATSNLSYTYVLVVGESLTFFLFYFLFYQGINFGFIYVWLLQILLVALIPVFFKSRKYLGRVFLIAIICMAALLAIQNSVSIYLYANNSSYSAQPGKQAIGASNFLISQSGNSLEFVGASMQVSSVLLGQMSAYPGQKLQHVVSEVLYSYNIDFEKGGVSSAYGNMTAYLNYFVVTKYETQNGIYGDVNPSYLNSSQLATITTVLDAEQNVIFDSGISTIYSLT